MDEEELLPGVDGQTFEIRLGEEFANQGDVVPTPQELNEMAQDDLVEAIVNMPVPEGTEEIHRHYVGDIVNQMGAYRVAYDHLMEQTATLLQNEIADAFQAPPLGNLNLGVDAVVGYDGNFTYEIPINRGVEQLVLDEETQRLQEIQRLEALRNNGVEARLNAEAQLEQLRGMVRDTGMIPVNTQRPPVENTQEVNLGQRTGRITRDQLQEAVNTVRRGRETELEGIPNTTIGIDARGYVYDGIRTVRRTQRQATPANDWGEIAWKDTNEERVRRIEDFREELLKLMEDSDGSEKSMKKLKSFIELY